MIQAPLFSRPLSRPYSISHYPHRSFVAPTPPPTIYTHMAEDSDSRCSSEHTSLQRKIESLAKQMAENFDAHSAEMHEELMPRHETQAAVKRVMDLAVENRANIERVLDVWGESGEPGHIPQG